MADYPQIITIIPSYLDHWFMDILKNIFCDPYQICLLKMVLVSGQSIYFCWEVKVLSELSGTVGSTPFCFMPFFFDDLHFAM